MDVRHTVDGYGQESASGLNQLKNRVVFTYGFMEMMFWLWVSSMSPSAFYFVLQL